MAYHETYWVAIAAAAPIVALANTVSMTDIVNVWLESESRGRSLNSRMGYFTVLFGSGANLVIQAYLLYDALERLLKESDGKGQPIVAGIFVVGGLLYVLLIVIAGIILRYQLRRDESKGEKDDGIASATPVDIPSSSDDKSNIRESGLGWPISE